MTRETEVTLVSPQHVDRAEPADPRELETVQEGRQLADAPGIMQRRCCLPLRHSGPHYYAQPADEKPMLASQVRCGHMLTVPGATFDLDAIEARAKAATPGPWFARGGEVRQDNTHGASWHLAKVQSWCTEENATFIAAAREDVPALVAEVRRLARLASAWEEYAREMGALLEDTDEPVPDDHPIAKAWADLRALGVEP